MKLTTNKALTFGAIGFAAFALWYIRRSPAQLQPATKQGLTPVSFGYDAKAALVGWQQGMTKTFAQTTAVTPEIADQLGRVGVQ